MTNSSNSNSNNNNNNKKKECSECVEMLKQVLTQTASRPRAILEAMGSSSNYNPTHNGVVVSFQQQEMNSIVDNNEKPEKQSVRKHGVTMKTPSTTSSPQPLAASAATNEQQQLKIECRPCGTHGPEGGARAFVMGPSPLSVVLCSNRLHSDEKEMEQVLVHELIHVFDVKSLQLDLRNCVNLAYSEIRAAREAECHESWMQPYCIKQKALQATQNLFPQQAGSCISSAYTQAMQDLRPFSNNNNESGDSSTKSNGHSER